MLIIQRVQPDVIVRVTSNENKETEINEQTVQQTYFNQIMFVINENSRANCPNNNAISGTNY